MVGTAKAKEGKGGYVGEKKPRRPAGLQSQVHIREVMRLRGDAGSAKQQSPRVKDERCGKTPVWPEQLLPSEGEQSTIRL